MLFGFVCDLFCLLVITCLWLFGCSRLEVCCVLNVYLGLLIGFDVWYCLIVSDFVFDVLDYWLVMFVVCFTLYCVLLIFRGGYLRYFTTVFLFTLLVLYACLFVLLMVGLYGCLVFSTWFCA